MRLFIAVSIPPDVQTHFKRVQDKLAQAAPHANIRWSPSGQFHVTLNFLRDVAAHRFEGLEKAVSDACTGFPTIPLIAHDIGFFPDSKHPKVIWAGVDDTFGYLARLQKSLTRAVHPFVREVKVEKFVSHVTLGRINRADQASLENLHKCAAKFSRRPFGAWPASEVNIYRSILSPAGAEHTLLTSCPLAK